MNMTNTSRKTDSKVNPTAIARDLYLEIKDFINARDGKYREWFVGLTSGSVNSCLFVQHRVSEDSDRWIFRECPNATIARNIKDALIKLGCDGTFHEGWDQKNVSVYAYQKGPITAP